MAYKIFNIDKLGQITVYKRKGTKRLSLKVVNDKIRITQPFWMPYAASIKFAKDNKEWIDQQSAKYNSRLYTDNHIIGKQHLLNFLPGQNLRTRIKSGKIEVYVPVHLSSSHPDVQKITISAVKRALKKEADTELPKRIRDIASKHHYDYHSIKTKSMKSRWGSCTNQNIITLNIYLMMVPWELIDYVILHELVHTHHLNHSKQFWEEVSSIMPDYKDRKKTLKQHQQNAFVA